jgi:hypothetical protein
MLVPLALADELVLPSVCAEPGSRIALPVKYISDSGYVTSVHFQVHYDQAAISLEDEGFPPSGTTISTVNPSGNGRRFGVVAQNGYPIPSGTLVYLVVDIHSAVPDGLYTLTLSDIIAINQDGVPAAVEAVNGTILVQGNFGRDASVSTRVDEPSLGASAQEGPVSNGPRRPGVARPVTLTWVPSTSPNVAGYSVYRGDTAGGPYTRITPDLVTATSYVDGVLPGTSYYYVVTAVDTEENESDYSNEAFAQIPRLWWRY